MAGREFSDLFASAFQRLAKGKPVTPKWLWKSMARGGYDFSYGQMDCDDSLRVLALLRDCGRCRTKVYGPLPAKCGGCGHETKSQLEGE